MRRLMSLGLALVIVAGVALWMGSGVIVQGGLGPGNGERPFVSILNADGEANEAPDEGEAGVDHEAENGHEDGHGEDGVDPHLTIAERNASSIGEEAEPRSVRIKTFTVEMLPLEVPLRGETRASAIVTATAETTATVDEVHVTKGEKVAIGDKLCTLDPGPRQAALDQARAALDQAQLDYDTNAKLRAAGTSPANTAAAFEVALKGAQAALDNAQAEFDRTEINAKAAGIIQDPLAKVGSLLAAGAPCATIVELDPIIFAGSVPEARIGLARTGLEATIETVSGATGTGKVSYISPVADTATRSFEAEIEIPNPDGRILAGLTANATVDMGSVPAHLIPQSSLTLDNDGTLGVRAVENDLVVFHPVEIIMDTRDGVWLNGLPPRVDIITLGQEYVEAGQPVIARSADEGTAS